MGLLSSKVYDEIKYTITVTFEDLTTGNLVDFSQIVLKQNVELNYFPIEIDKREISLYVEEKLKQYCYEHGLSPNDLFLDGYEITHKNSEIDIFFNVQDMQEFSLEPSVMAVRNACKERPILEAEQINENTVKWSWEWAGGIEYTSVLTTFDEETRVVAHTPLNVNYFIETDLDIDTIQTRVVTIKNRDNEISSVPISIKVLCETREAIFRKYKAPVRNEEYKLESTQIATRLKAFQSGVGYDEDCMLYKPNETKYANKFKLMNKVYGVRASSKIRYNTVKYFYRFMLKGKVNYKGYDGSFKVKVRAIMIPNIEDEPTNETIGEYIESRQFCEYRFNDKTFVSEVYMKDVFTDLIPAHRNHRYKFEVTLYDINGRMEVYSQALGVNQIVDVEKESFTFELKGYYDTKIVVKSLPILKQKDYIEIYPPEEFEPLVGAVNGDFEVSESGKKDTIAFAPEFEAPDIVFDKKYYCLIEEDKTNPEIADIGFKFDNQVDGEIYTDKNGDRVVFSCDTIIEDETEYREYITQIDRGDFVINDNRKHSYRYKLKLSNLAPERYKRFEIDVTTNVNDILVISQEVDFDISEDDYTAELHVAVRSLQSAIARWNPYIHSGYYYYNQDEHFLFHRSNINGLNVSSKQFSYKGEIAVNVKVSIKGGDGKYEQYVFELNSKKDLDTNPKRFEYIDGMIWPKPSSVVDGFPNYETDYAYYTKPFICKKEPTEILSVTWDEITAKYTAVEAYAVTYNEVYGEWREPVRIEHGKPVPKEVIPSRIMMIKFVLRPSLRPQIKEREYIYSCEGDWFSRMDNNLSYNVYFKKEVLEQRSKRTKGYLITKIQDLGDTIEKVKERSVCYTASLGSGAVVYYQESDEYTLMDNSCNVGGWTKMDYGETYMVKRYVRFKVELNDGSRVKYLRTLIKRYEYTDMAKEEYLPAFGNVRFKAEYNPENFIKQVDYTASMLLSFDQNKYVLVENMKQLGNNLGVDQSFSSKDIVEVNFYPVGMHAEEYDIIYEKGKFDPVMADVPLLIKSRSYKEDNELKENNQAGVIVKPTSGKSIDVSPIPQQFAPIIIQEELFGGTKVIPYRQVYFTDMNGQYSLSNTEEFESLGFKTLYLKNYDIDESSVTVRINSYIVEGFKIDKNILIFDEEVPRGSIVSVMYRLKYSFISMYDYERNLVRIELHGENILYNVGDIRVHYETHETSALRKLDHVSLNPIYNPLYSGYIYISDKLTTPYKVSVVPSDNLIYANGRDTMNVLVLVEDKDGNPMENINVNAIAALGKLNAETMKTDINGIAHYTYTSWTGDCIDKIKAIATDSAYGECEITNRKITNEIKNAKENKGDLDG